jgi:hypothetical protein
MLRHSAVIHRHQRRLPCSHLDGATLALPFWVQPWISAMHVRTRSVRIPSVTQQPTKFRSHSAIFQGAVLAGVDDGFVLAPLGFSFSFYGTDYSDAFLSTNGLITFTTGTLQFGNVDLTTSGPSV